MQSLTTKELAAVECQLDLERLLVSKCRDAEEATADQTLRCQFRSCAQQHKINYQTLVRWLEGRGEEA